MRQIWTVEVGEYSDHEILAVFDLEDTARKFATRYNDDPDRSEFSSRASVGSVEYWPASKLID